MSTSGSKLAVAVAVLILGCASGPPPAPTAEADQAFASVQSGPLGASEEPPLLFALGHEDGWTGVAAGGSVEVPASSEPQAVTLQLAPFRQFNTKGIEFRYPRSMSWEADHELLVKTWVISGNAAKIMMFQYGAGQHEQLRRDVTTEMLGSYQAAGSASRAPAHLALGGTTYAGERMSVNLVGAALELTLVSFDADGPTILILQDSPEVPGQVTQEMTDLLDLMGSSWKVR